MSKFIKSAYEAEPKISMGYVLLPPSLVLASPLCVLFPLGSKMDRTEADKSAQ